MKYKEFVLRCKDLIKHENIVKHKRHIIIGIPVIIVMIVIGGWFMFDRSGDSGIIHPSSSGRSSSAASVFADGSATGGVVDEYDYTEAPDHIGERAIIRGTVVRTFTAKSGVTFLDFCQGFDACPFSAVIFASDLKKFGDLKSYERAVKLTGVIKDYQGQAEMVLNNVDQIE
jgi:hypothetical protein